MYTSIDIEEIRDGYHEENYCYPWTEEKEELIDILNLDIEWGLLPIEFIDRPLDELEPEILNELLGGR